MRIKDILSGNFHRTERSQRKDQEKAELEGTAKSSHSAATPPSDKAQISHEAKDLQVAASLISESVEVLKSMPAVREDAVARAKARVESGFYDRADVVESLAEIIGEHLRAESPVSASDLATDIVSHVNPGMAGLTKSDLVNIRQDLQQGLYQNSEVLDEIADRIYRFLDHNPESE